MLMVTGPYGTKSGKPLVVEVEARMADEIRRRRRRDESSALTEDEESDGPHSTRDVLADEPVLGSGTTGPQFPLLFRPRTRTLSSTRSSISEVGDHCERDSLLRPEKLQVDPSQNWWQRTQKTLRGDFSSICLLLFLYLLQGIPLGLIAAIPLVLSSKNASYGQQAVFSFAYWPFSLKLLWAPIVDSVYWKRMGRRKSWMVPCQYLIGIFMLVLSYKVSDIMGDNGTEQSGKAPNVVFLMLVFLPLNFLAATQDIAVDGWALTMLSRKNVGYASTCNAVGQTAGFFLGNVVYLTLDSPDFANRFFRSEPLPYGLVSLSGFVFFWGWVFLITTTLVLLFKKEVDHSLTPSSADDADELELGIVETYAVLWKIVRLKPMMWMLVVLLTGKFAFAATDGITGLKLIGMGMPKDKLSSMAVFLTPLQVLLPWMIGKYTAGPRPLNVFLLSYPYRIFMGGVFAALVWWTPSFRLPDGDFPVTLYAIWVIGYCFHQVASYCMFVSMMAFNAQISDPKIGGTYMTLLNTLNNLGGNWPVTLILSLTGFFTFKDCVVKGTKTVLYSCNTKALADQCTKGGDVCELRIDGYYIAVAFCSLVGIIWFKALFSKIKYFQKIPRSDWSVMKK